MAQTRGNLRDPRQILCDHLRSIGVEARPGDVTQEGEGGPRLTTWIVDVAEGPIRHVLVWERFQIASSESAPDRAERGFSYLVEDSRILGNLAEGETDVGLEKGCWVIPGDSWEDRGGWWSQTVEEDVGESVRMTLAANLALNQFLRGLLVNSSTLNRSTRPSRQKIR